MGIELFVVKLFEGIPKFVAESFEDRFVRFVQVGSDDESHLAAVFEEGIDSLGSNSEGCTRKVSGNTVVLDAPFKRRNVELVDKICPATVGPAFVNRGP